MLPQQPMQGAPLGAPQLMIPPPIPPEVLEKAQRIVTQPSWEDISGILRSKDRRNYKINISTDAMEEEDDVEQKEQVLSFGTTIIEMLEKIIPAAQGNPTLAPFARELIMAVVKEFKAGRPLEEALEDGLNQIQNQPAQQQPNPEMIKAQAEITKAQSEAQVAQMRMALEKEKVQAQIANDQANRQLDVAKHQADSQLKLSDQQMQHEKAMLDLQMKREQVELGKLNTLLNLKKLGISSRAQALAEWEASGDAADMHERRQADIAAQHQELALQAHDQVNKHAIEHRKIDAQRDAAATQAAIAAQKQSSGAE